MKYEIPVFQLPAIKHKFADNSLQYCLTKLTNEEHSFSMMSDKVERTSFHSFKVFIKNRVLETYKAGLGSSTVLVVGIYFGYLVYLST